jgi:uncharacterized membrane protein
VDPAVIGLVGIAGILHVAWNVRLKTADDPLRAATIGMVAAAVVIVPLGVASWWASGAEPLAPEGVALGITSGALEVLFFVLLSAAYRRGDLSIVYPIARGTAPLVAIAIGVGLFGEQLGLGGSIGVVLLLGGFLVLQRPWRAVRGRAAFDPAIAFALATGVMIAAYSAVDRLGTQRMAILPYAAILWITAAAGLTVWVALIGGGRLFRDGPGAVRRAAIGGWFTLAAYLLILVALSVAPLSAVAPLRESTTVLAAAWGSVRLGEAAGRGEAARRIGASVLIVGGALLLASGG